MLFASKSPLEIPNACADANAARIRFVFGKFVDELGRLRKRKPGSCSFPGRRESAFGVSLIVTPGQFRHALRARRVLDSAEQGRAQRSPCDRPGCGCRRARAFSCLSGFLSFPGSAEVA